MYARAALLVATLFWGGCHLVLPLGRGDSSAPDHGVGEAPRLTEASLVDSSAVDQLKQDAPPRKPWSFTLGAPALASYVVSLAVDLEWTYVAARVGSSTTVCGRNVGNQGTGIIVVALDRAGQCQWVTEVAGALQAEADMVVRGGRVTLAGTFTSDFSIITSSKAIGWGGTPPGGLDIFIVELDASTGEPKKVTVEGGPNDDRATALAVDAAGMRYLGGDFVNATSILGNSITIPSGQSAAFLAQLDGGLAAGLPTLESAIIRLAGGSAGQVFVVGKAAAGVFTMGPCTPKAGATGCASARNLGSALTASDLAVDATGDLYLAGWFNGSTNFSDSDTATPTGAQDLFLVSYSSSGAYRWLLTGGTPSKYNYGIGVAAAGSEVAMTGSFTGPMSLGGQTLTGNSDLLVATVKPSDGAVQQARGAGGEPTEQIGDRIAFHPDGLVVAGIYRGTPDLLGQVLPTTNGFRVFVLRIDK
jgi:hypothetical protein